MPIKVKCGACGKLISAKDSLAGKRVKCPACQSVIEIPAEDPLATRQERLDAADNALHDSLLNALYDNQFEKVASILQGFNLWMISTAVEEIEPLVANVEETNALIVFTSQAYVQQFASENTELAGPDGTISIFAANGPNVFEHLHEDNGLLFNPGSEHGLLLDHDCINEIRDHWNDPGLRLPSVQVQAASPDERDAQGDPDAVALRKQVLSTLNSMGFFPADWMPLADLDRVLRPETEIRSRFLALASVFAWASAPPDIVPDDDIKTLVGRNQLGHWIANSEQEILELPRYHAQQQFAETVGWRLENMWPLAWVMGYDRQPDIGSAQIEPEVIRELMLDFLGGFDASGEIMMKPISVRSSANVNRLEDLFYCAHNAVRSAQFGDSPSSYVPPNFDPIGHGGVVHERRHSLTWCLSPGTDWDDTDLST